MELRTCALEALRLTDPDAKVAATQALQAQALAGRATADPSATLTEAPGPPGRPALPRLVAVQQVPQRSVATSAGRAALLHAIVHIEFNAINLALDAVWRFGGLPDDFYLDWLRVAGEESTHFSLMREHLRTLGHDYGDFDAHDGLWAMAERTCGDVVARMALVPRTLEARGLDATPPIQAKLRRAGDARAVAILDIILRDEIRHVATGNRWYRWLCGRRGLDPLVTYADLVERYNAPRLRPPFNLASRSMAGYSAEELEALRNQR